MMTVRRTMGRIGLWIKWPKCNKNSIYPFSSQAEVLTFARLAGDTVKATKMDRPEWVAVNPEMGKFMLR